MPPTAIKPGFQSVARSADRKARAPSAGEGVADFVSLPAASDDADTQTVNPNAATVAAASVGPMTGARVATLSSC